MSTFPGGKGRSIQAGVQTHCRVILTVLSMCLHLYDNDLVMPKPMHYQSRPLVFRFRLFNSLDSDL